MDIPWNLIIPVMSGVMVAMITQFFALRIQQQRAMETRVSKELDVGDRAADRASKESEMLRSELKERVGKLEAKADALSEQNEDCKRREMTLQWKLNMVEFQCTQLRDENNRLRADRGEPPMSPPPPPPEPFPPRDQPPPRPVTAPNGPPKDQPPPPPGEAPRRYEPRH